jgi:hypothetical protein
MNEKAAVGESRKTKGFVGERLVHQALEPDGRWAGGLR